MLTSIRPAPLNDPSRLAKCTLNAPRYRMSRAASVRAVGCNPAARGARLVPGVRPTNRLVPTSLLAILTTAFKTDHSRPANGGRALFAPIEQSTGARKQARRAPRERRTGSPVWRFVATSAPLILRKNLVGIKRIVQPVLRQPPVRRSRFIQTAASSCGFNGSLQHIGQISLPVFHIAMFFSGAH